MLFGESGPGYTGHVFEDLLAGHLTPDEYRGLWTGKTDWKGSKVEEVLVFLKEILENFANDDYLSLSWGDTLDRYMSDTVGMMIMGDWTHGAFKSKGFKNYSWAPPMGTKGIFVMLSDSFGLPKGAPHPQNATNWLRVCGSIEGQENFNIYKGSIPARTDVDLNKFDEYQRAAIEDFKKDELVPSIAHGAAAKEAWLQDYVIALNTFATNKDIQEVQEMLAKACGDAGACG
jgi:glucose/mannose transport system substrate-binding protein